MISVTLTIILLTSSVPISFEAFPQSPLHQLKSGVSALDISCKENHVYVIRSNGAIACVTKNTAEKLDWIIPDRSLEIDDDSFVPELTNQRLVTSFDDIEATPNAMSFCPDWPKNTIDTPTQVRIGEEFEVRFTWTYITEDDKMETGEWPDICYENKIGFINDEFVEIIDNKYTFVEKNENWDVVPAIIRDSGYIPLEFENTQEHTEIIKMKINEPRFDNIAGIIQFVGGSIFDRYLIIDNGVVTFSELEDFDVDIIDANETLNMTTIESRDNTQPDPNFRPPMDALAEFLKKYYPDADPEEILKNIGVSQDYIKEFLEKYPELK